MRTETILIGAPTLFKTYRVMTGKGFANAQAILEELTAADNVSVSPVTMPHFQMARDAFDRYGVGIGGGREALVLNIFDCMTFAAARVSDTPLLFKGDDSSAPICRSIIQASVRMRRCIRNGRVEGRSPQSTAAPHRPLGSVVRGEPLLYRCAYRCRSSNLRGRSPRHRGCPFSRCRRGAFRIGSMVSVGAFVIELVRASAFAATNGFDGPWTTPPLKLQPATLRGRSRAGQRLGPS